MQNDFEVVEMARFSVTDGAVGQLRTAAQKLDAWLQQQPGYMSRILVGPDERGAFTDLVRWRRRADAMAAGEKIMGEPSAREFLALIAPGSVDMRHGTVLHESSV